MEIVFFILKTVGIILLIILCLFLIAAALLLFVPVRYRAEGRIPEEGKPQASIRFTWLLHLISFRVEYTDGLKMTLRAAGIRIRPERWKRRGKTPKARKTEQGMEEKGAAGKEKTSGDRKSSGDRETSGDQEVSGSRESFPGSGKKAARAADTGKTDPGRRNCGKGRAFRKNAFIPEEQVDRKASKMDRGFKGSHAQTVGGSEECRADL